MIKKCTSLWAGFCFFSSVFIFVTGCKTRTYNQSLSAQTSASSDFLDCPLTADTAPIRTLPAIHFFNRALVLISGEIEADKDISQADEIAMVQSQFRQYENANKLTRSASTVCDVIAYLTESVPYLGYVELEIEEWQSTAWKPMNFTSKLNIESGSEAERYINRITKRFQAQLKDAKNSKSWTNSWVNAIGTQYIDRLQELSGKMSIDSLNQEVINIIKPLISNSNSLLNLSNKFADFRQKTDAELFDEKNIRNKIDQLSGGTSSASTQILTTVLGTYFSALETTVKANITLDLLDESPQFENPAEFFGVFINRSGPQFKKVLQMFGENPTLPEKIRDLMMEQQSRSRPEQPNFVEKEMKKSPLFQNLLASNRVTLAPWPMAVASVAQVTRAAYFEPNGDAHQVVIRMIKRKQEQRVNADNLILKGAVASSLRKLANDNTTGELTKFRSLLLSFGQMVEGFTESVRSDFDMDATVRNHLEALKHYDGEVAEEKISRKGQNDFRLTIQYKVPKIFEASSDEKTFMILELAKGTKIQKLESQNGQKVQTEELTEIFKNLYKFWLWKAIFSKGEGFFHGDMHPGNLLAHVNSKSPSELNIDLWIIDFGMASTISCTQQEALLGLSIALKLKDWSNAAKILNSLSTSQQDAKTEILTELLKQIQGKVSISEAIATASSDAVNLEMISTVISLGRGMSTIEESLGALNIDAKVILNEVSLALLKENSNVWRTVLKSSRGAANSKVKGAGQFLGRKVRNLCTFTKQPEI